MKKVYSWLLIVVMLASLTACNKTDPNQTQPVFDHEKLAEMVQQVGNFLYTSVEEPGFGSVGGEWLILGLARSDMEIPEEYFETYFQNVSAYTAKLGGVLHTKKYTEYSRVILAVTAIDRNPSDVGGYDLLLPLADYGQTVFQGLNGPIFALLALDSGNYEIPKNTTDSTQATRELYIDYILNAQLLGGGWSLAGGEAEIDLTAMALQALAKYKDRQDVAEAIEKGLNILSTQQNENGGYTAYQVESSESISQTIVALSELGISLDDSRFVKNGNSLLDALLRFRQEDGGFSHLLDGETDMLATEQAFYALVAADRVAKGSNSLYNMQG